MKKIILPMLLLGLSAPVFGQSIVVVSPAAKNSGALPVAYEELRTGRNAAAIAHLTTTDAVAANDPARLINLGTAYARTGRSDQAAAMYRAAIYSPVRYDLELANGSYVDSRWAARTALGQLRAGRPALALAAQ